MALTPKQPLKDIVRLSIQEASQLSNELWNDDRCKPVVDEFIQLLLRPGMLNLFAIHEAGHEIYFRKAGCTGFIFETPKIIYDEKSKEPFTEQRAAIRIGNYVDPETNDWLLKLARGFAAGGRCSLRLTTTDYAGDTCDRRFFDKVYRTSSPNATDEAIDKMWLQAQVEVNEDLNDEVLQAQVRAKAHEIMPQLFPWLNT